MYVVMMWVWSAGPPPVMAKMMSGKLKIQITLSRIVRARVVEMLGKVIERQGEVLTGDNADAAPTGDAHAAYAADPARRGHGTERQIERGCAHA